MSNVAGPLEYAQTHPTLGVRPLNPQPGEFTSQDFTTPSTSVIVTLPARNLGDRLYLFLNRSSASSDAIATPSGWTALDASSLTGTASSFCRVYRQDVNATNASATTASFTGGTSTESNSLVVRLTGLAPSVPETLNATAQGSNTTTVDPAALTGPNAGAVQRTIYIAYVGTSTQDTLSGATPAVTGFPSGYSSTGTSTTADAGAASNGCGQGWGIKIAVAGSDNPSAWTYCPTGTGRALAITLAVRGVVE